MSDHAGHRLRLRQRFEKSGIDALLDYEVLEVLLSFSIPRFDTKPAAKELLRKFKSLNGVLNAPAETIEETHGLGANSAFMLSFLRDFTSCLLREKLKGSCVISNRQDAEEYLRFNFGGRKEEYVAALFLDSGNRITSSEVVSTGTVNQCAVYPRSVFELALKHGAASVIIAHNHPGGTKTPSEADWKITERLAAIGKLMDIPLLDHILLTDAEALSFRNMPGWAKIQQVA